MKKLILPLLVLMACKPPASADFSHGTWIDLSYTYDDQTIYWPTDTQGFVKDTVSEGMTEKGYYYSAYDFCSAEHGGTHLDAPVHFAEGKHSVEQIPVDQLVGTAIVIDVSEKALKDRDYQVTQEDFIAWEAHNEMIPDGVILLIRTGYGQYWPDRKQYLGTDKMGPEAIPELHFPGLHPDGATWLSTERNIKAVGLDTPSIDYGQSTMFESHQILFKNNIPAFENVANLDQLHKVGSWVFALPMKIGGGSGAPVRIIGWVPHI
ncbi:MAG: cyclase family protein [Bacteroidetes bacterium]|nr:cyclase family protein [Bacteroidota bacterium]